MIMSEKIRALHTDFWIIMGLRGLFKKNKKNKK